MRKASFVLLFSVLLLGACSSQEDQTSESQPSSSESFENSITIESSNNDSALSFSNDEVDLVINNLTTGRGMDNSEIVFIDYTARNKSSISVDAQYLFMYYVTAYQNETELEFGYIDDTTDERYEAVQKLDQEIYSNEEVTASFTYKLIDSNAPIELRFHDRNQTETLKTDTFEIE
ncbi:DUF5067 domain-containing protein [Enterococcus sp. BWR-S5]|uniref:DUF5067 domain-containing protein n=1 Tax=Enterococcus sp. BWR-S5 TaxID=2787714 RepID=UPI0019245832|nr:DUF5067 domain-containing protein [Enterococcus sp. BWR-S5]MBL1225413.1 DUF5067 domain-containing protein [Enterococcus sp. BWR-S5]